MSPVTLTNVRCEGCGASISPVVERGWETYAALCDCGHVNHLVNGGARPRAPAPPDVVGLALSECAAAFDGVSSHGRARLVVEALRNAVRLEVDPLTRAKLGQIMGRS